MLAPFLCWGQGYTISTVAGGGLGTGDGLPATSVLVLPAGVVVDPAGNLYIAQLYANYISKVTPNGIISTFAGTPSETGGYAGDGGPARSALFSGPAGLALDSAGSLYVADTGNSRIRKISSSGTITTVAGGGTPNATFGDGGPATSAYLGGPSGVAVDSAGNLYITDGSSVRKVDSRGTITTIAGCLPTDTACYNLGFTGSVGDGGPAIHASLSLPSALVVDAAGNLFIADTANNRIRKISTSGIITTVAGSGAGSFQGDGGPATSAGLYQPRGVAVDSAGNIFVDDSGDYRIRMVTTDGTITTIAGTGAARQQGGSSGDGGAATNASLGETYGIALSSTGVVYVAELLFDVRALTPGGSGIGPPPSIKGNGVVSSSAFGQFSAVAPGSWIEIYGVNLAADTRGWTSADFSGTTAPTSLDGTSVTIGGVSAFVGYISPTEVEAQVPSTVGTGSQSVVVSTAAGPSSAYMVTVNSQQPGLLAPSSYNVGGNQYVQASFSDGTTFVPPGAQPGTVSRRPQAGESITLYGVGFGSVTPDSPAGQVVQQSNALVLPLQISFGQTQATVSYAGLALNTVGLYQFNVVVPNIASSDLVPLTFTLGGIAGTQTLYIAVQN